MVSFQIPLTTLVQFSEPKNGFLTDAGRTVVQQLINRTGGPIGGTILFAGSSVWIAPTGGVSRTTFDTAPALPVGVGYSQAEVTAIRDELLLIARHLAALIKDCQTVGVVK